MSSRVVAFAASLLSALAACAGHVTAPASPAAPELPAEPAWLRAPCTERLPDGTRLLVGVGELEPWSPKMSPKLRDVTVGNRARAAVCAIGTAYIGAVFESRNRGEPILPPIQPSTQPPTQPPPTGPSTLPSTEPDHMEASIVAVETVVFTNAKPEVTELWVSPAGVAYARAVLRVDRVNAVLVDWMARHSIGEPVFAGLFERFEAKCRRVPPPTWR